MDCAGLLVISARDCGVELEDLQVYGRSPDPSRLMPYVERNFDQVNEPLPGHVLMFWIRKTREPQHFGILAENNKIIHAYSGIGKVAEMEFDNHWRKRHLTSWQLSL